MSTTETAILDAAQEMFTAYGYGATTTRALAERAGVNEVTVFRRFGSKSGVLRALGRRVADQSAGTAAVDLSDDLDLRAALTALARSEVDSALRFGGLALRLAFEAQSQPEVAEMIGAGTGGNLAALTGFLQMRQDRGELRADVSADLLAEGFFALTSSFVLGRILTGDRLGAGDATAQGTDDALVDQLVSLYLDGATRPAPEPRPAQQPGASRRPHNPYRRTQ